MARRRGTTGPVLGRYHVDGDVLYEVIVDCLAAHRLTRLVTKDEFPPTAAFREAILARYPIEGSFLDDRHWSPVAGERVAEAGEAVRMVGPGGKVIRGQVFFDRANDRLEVISMGPPQKWGTLVTCPWCSGFWLTGVVLVLRKVAPRVWSPLGRALAYSSIVGWLSGHLG